MEMRTLILSLKGRLKWTSLYLLVLALGCPLFDECDNGKGPVTPPPAKKSAFTFEVSPTDVGVEPGSTTVATVSIDRDPSASGTDFAGGILFSVRGLPQGVTGVFSPNPVPDSLCTLTVSCAPSAPFGSSPATITATSGTETETLSLQVAVTGAGGDYYLSVTPTITRLLRKQSRTDTFAVDITRLGYEGTIELGVGLGIPPCNILGNFRARFYPPATLGNTSKLVLDLWGPPQNLAGVCTLYVHGREGGQPVRHTPLTVEVSPWSQVFCCGGLYDVAFINTNTATAVGPDGRILRTINGGDTWFDQDSRTSERLEAVHFIDANVGFAVGFRGTILHTTDGGGLWSVQSGTTEDQDLYGVHFYDAQIGTAVGRAGTILHTIDGGATWEDQSMVAGVRFRDVFMIDANVAVAVGDLGGIARTEDGGSLWEYERLPRHNFRTLRQVCFIDNQTGMAAGPEGFILRTYDGGVTWPTRQSIGVNRGTNGVAFVDADTGYVSIGSGGDFAKILRTTDGGQSWVEEYIGGDLTYRLSAVDGETVMMTDYFRLIRRDGPQ
jgi:photosystem II stability/assembly factor-like uncharacterized protein